MTYRFFGDDRIRHDLYPYAKGGPVTYTQPGQELAGLFGDAGNMPITAGWYQSSLGFFHYLVDHGLQRNPVARVAPGTTPGAQTAPWAGIMVVLVGLAALSLNTLAMRPRVLAVGRRGPAPRC